MSSSPGPRINDALMALITLEHRIDPLFRDSFDLLFQRPLANLIQLLLRLTHHNPETRLCQEMELPGEAEATRAIIDHMSRFTEREYKGRVAERAGNTKTYGLVQAEFEVRADLPANLRHGIFREPRRYSAWIRLGSPGPALVPDVEDAGILSIGIKLTGVEGPKLLDDESGTQDFLGISCPTFTTPNVIENVKLQRKIWERIPVFYFLNPLDSHILDGAMQGVFSRMNSNPVEARYWSCVPYLLGEGQAMKYSVRPRGNHRTKIPWDIPDEWLRQALAQTLHERDVEFDFLIQLQTDPQRMPIEDAAIEWPEHLSTFIPAARIRIPKQEFDNPERFLLARKFSFNPWHTIAEHRPLGNQGRARKTIYGELSRLRQSMNREPHLEPGN